MGDHQGIAMRSQRCSKVLLLQTFLGVLYGCRGDLGVAYWPEEIADPYHLPDENHKPDHLENTKKQHDLRCNLRL